MGGPCPGSGPAKSSESNSMAPHLSRRAARLTHSPTLEIHQRVDELRKRGRHVVHFGFGQSPFPPAPPVTEALKKHVGDTRYLPSQGLPQLREAASDYLAWRFGHDAAAERIVVGPGSKELMFDALLAFDGDLILPAPSWVSYAPQAKLLGKRVVWVQTDPEQGYRLAADDLTSACEQSKSRQRILILNSPCNPTGAVYSRDELKAIASAAQRHNVLVLSDEIYAEITFTRGRYTSITAFCPERTIVTTGLSKGFSAGGYRLGIMLLPRGMEAATQRFVSLASGTFSCVSAPVQHAAVAAFSRDRVVRTHVEDTVQIHRIASEYVAMQLVEIGVRCPRPQGAFYLFPDFAASLPQIRLKGSGGDRALCGDALDPHGVAMLPGSAFGVPQSHLAVRLASVDYDGAAALRAYRRTRPRTRTEKRRFVEKHCPNLAEGVRRIQRYLAG